MLNPTVARRFPLTASLLAQEPGSTAEASTVAFYLTAGLTGHARDAARRMGHNYPAR